MARAVGSSGDRDVSIRRVVLWASHDQIFPLESGSVYHRRGTSTLRPNKR